MSIPKNVHQLLNDKEAIKVLTSVNEEGIPHSIVVGSTMSNGELLCAAEVLMKKTTKNLAINENVAILVVKGAESYLVNGTVVEKQTEGEMFESVKTQMAEKGMPVSGLWIFKPTTIFNQSAGPEAGTQIC